MTEPTTTANPAAASSSIPSDLLAGPFVEFLKRSQIPQWSAFYTDLDALALAIETNLNENSPENENLKVAFQTLKKYCIDYQLTVKCSFHDGWFMPPSKKERENMQKMKKDDKTNTKHTRTKQGNHDEEDELLHEEAGIAQRLMNWLISKTPTMMEEDDDENNDGTQSNEGISSRLRRRRLSGAKTPSNINSDDPLEDTLSRRKRYGVDKRKGRSDDSSSASGNDDDDDQDSRKQQHAPGDFRMMETQSFLNPVDLVLPSDDDATGNKNQNKNRNTIASPSGESTISFQQQTSQQPSSFQSLISQETARMALNLKEAKLLLATDDRKRNSIPIVVRGRTIIPSARPRFPLVTEKEYLKQVEKEKEEDATKTSATKPAVSSSSENGTLPTITVSSSSSSSDLPNPPPKALLPPPPTSSSSNLLFTAPLRRPAIDSAYSTITNPAIIGYWIVRLVNNNNNNNNDNNKQQNLDNNSSNPGLYQRYHEEIVKLLALEKILKAKQHEETGNEKNILSFYPSQQQQQQQQSSNNYNRLVLVPSPSHPLAPASVVETTSGEPIMTSSSSLSHPQVSPLAKMFNEITFSLTTIHSAYRKIAKAFLKEVNKVTNFYSRQSEVISSAIATCVDAAKCGRFFSDRNKTLYINAFREAYDALDLLQEYCEQNVVAITKAFDALEQAQKRHIVIEAADSLMKLPFALTKNAGLQLLRGDLIDAFRRSYLVTRLLPDIISKEDMEVKDDDDDAETAEQRAARKRLLNMEIPKPLEPHQARRLLQNADGGGHGRGGRSSDGGDRGDRGSGGDSSGSGGSDSVNPLFSWWYAPRQASSFLIGLTLALLATAASNFFALDQPTLYIQNNLNTWFHFTVTFSFPFWYILFSIALFVWESIGVNYPYMFSLQSAWNPWELLRNSFFYMFWWSLFAFAYTRRALEEQDGWKVRQAVLDAATNVTLTNILQAQQSEVENNFTSYFSYISYTPLLAKDHPGKFANEDCFSFFIAANSTLNFSDSSNSNNFTDSLVNQSYFNKNNFNCEYKMSIFDDPLGPSGHAWIFPYCIWPIFAFLFFWFQFYMHNPARKRWLLPTLARVVVTPYHKTIAFSDFILCAFLISFGTMWFELQYFWCYLDPRDDIYPLQAACFELRAMRWVVLRAIPLLWRIGQCLRNYTTPPPAKRTFFPHGLNACKFTLVLFAFYSRMFIGIVRRTRTDLDSEWLEVDHQNEALIDASYYVFWIIRGIDGLSRSTWDILIDFGLGPFGQHQNKNNANNSNESNKNKTDDTNKEGNAEEMKSKEGGGSENFINDFVTVGDDNNNKIATESDSNNNDDNSLMPVASIMLPTDLTMADDDDHEGSSQDDDDDDDDENRTSTEEQKKFKRQEREIKKAIAKQQLPVIPTASPTRMKLVANDPKMRLVGIRSAADDDDENDKLVGDDNNTQKPNTDEQQQSSASASSPTKSASSNSANTNNKPKTFFGLWNIRPLLFPVWCYPVLLFIEIAIRFAWIGRFFAGQVLHRRAQWIPIVFVVVDLVRRFVWLLARVENEQVNNVELYKVTKAAPPLNLNKNYSQNSTSAGVQVPSAGSTTAVEASSSTTANEDNRLSAIWDSASNTIALKDTSIAVLLQEQQQQQQSSNNKNQQQQQPSNVLNILTNGSSIDRFFSLLPQNEKLAICKIAIPLTHRHPPYPFKGQVGEGKTRWFSTLTSELKVHVLLRRIGPRRTLGEYVNECSCSTTDYGCVI